MFGDLSERRRQDAARGNRPWNLWRGANPSSVTLWTRALVQLAVLGGVILASASAIPAAPEKVTLHGTVLDPRGAPLSDAAISLKELAAVTVSDHAGRFRFRRIPAGTYTVRATHIRFAPVEASVQAGGGTAAPVVIQLKEETPVLLDETVVTGTKTPRILGEAPLPVNVITRKEIATHHAETVAPVLDQVPGITQMPNGYARSSVSIHGLPEQYALLLVNGQRQYGRHADAKDLEHVPTDAIEQIEVVKGPSSVLYGSDAVAGVINVITRDGMREPALNLYASGGSQDTYTLRGSGGGSAFDWYHFLTGSWSQSDFMGEGYGFSNVNLRFNSWTTLQEAHRLGVEAGYFAEKTEDMPVTDEYAGGSYLDDEVIDVRGSWNWDPTNVSRWQAAAGYYDQSRRDARPGSDPRIWERSNFMAEIRNTTLLVGHSITSGVEVRYEDMKYTLVDGERDQTLLSFLAQDEWAWSEQVTLVAAARMERHDRWGMVAVPRLGLSLRPSPSMTVRLSGGTSFRAPSLTELYESEYFHPWGGGFWLGGNPDLEPEESIGTNLDVEYRTRSAAVSGGLFYNRLTDRISQADAGREIDGKAVRQLVNSEEAESWGAELQIRWVPLAGLRTKLAYTYLHTEDKATGLEFDYSPKHTVDMTANWEPSGQGLNVGVHGKLLGSRFASASRGNKLGRTYVLDVDAEKQVAHGLSLFAAVENALNEQLYWESRYFSDEYRKIRGGLRYRM